MVSVSILFIYFLFLLFKFFRIILHKSEYAGGKNDKEVVEKIGVAGK